MMDAEQIISKYLEIRDYIERKEKEHEEELKKYKAALVTLEHAAALLAKQTGQTSLKAASGTAFPTTNNRVRVEDRIAFHEFVFANHADQFLTAHVVKEAVEAWQEKNEGRLPPGISKESYIKWHIRQS